VQELAEPFGTHGAKTRGQVGNTMPGHPTGKPVIDAVGQATSRAGLAGRTACPDNHVVALAEPVQETCNFSRIMLPVRIHEHEDFTVRYPRAALDRRTVSH